MDDYEKLASLAKEFGGDIVEKTTYLGNYEGVEYFYPIMHDSLTGGYGLPFLIAYSRGEFQRTSFDQFIKITEIFQSTLQT